MARTFSTAIAQPKPLLDFADTEMISQVKIPSKVCFRLLLNDIENVPTPKKIDKDPSSQAFSLDDVLRREVRIILFDERRRDFVSNTHIIPMVASNEGRTWHFEALESVKLAREFTFRCN